MRVSAYLRAAVVTLPLAALATHASANFSGSYTMTFYLGPDHEKGSKQCAVFTHTGDVLGFPDSGTMIFSTYDDFEGFFIVDGVNGVNGKDLRFYGSSTYSDAEEDIHMRIRLKSDGTFGKRGGADLWKTGYPPTPLAGAIFTMKAGCAPDHFNGKQTRTLTGD